MRFISLNSYFNQKSFMAHLEIHSKRRDRSCFCLITPGPNSRLSLIKFTRASQLFTWKFYTVTILTLTKVRLFHILFSISFSNAKILVYLFLWVIAKNGVRKSASENRKKFIIYMLIIKKIMHEWNGHLEIFSRAQAMENSRQYFLLRTDVSQ